jgi:hypothetical protein
MNLYSIEMRVVATAYIKANNATEAMAKAKMLHGDGLEVADAGSEVAICGMRYSDPNLPEVSLSPAMTIWEPCQTMVQLSQENVPAPATS